MARIFEARSLGVADVRVAIVADRGRADLLVCRVNSYGLAVGDALWCITPDRGNATSVAFCSEGMAQLKVCFVQTRGEAGWVHDRPHPWRGRLGRQGR
ncbi:DUF6150 family protein [Paraburkholderia sp. D15]|uniref:DUF6150 family protein n=1 Tax=Paraburkholderia sp. D15 TaxID=2880218 RepID=UPI002479D896|nr:DUF6150 family protein [Paraburkholderia sp. D15]WGS52883.1 DUF6150 family protein [Paraburkholderia sp. D15]WKF61696.1 hypothetical protein HUO10_006228 [Paraburkholderia busanensis]